MRTVRPSRRSWRRSASWGAVAVLAAVAAAAAGPQKFERLSLKNPYPLELITDRDVALFHWLDSLAGTSGGKTIPAHRQQYVDEFGEVSDEAHLALQAFFEMRDHDLQSARELVLPGMPDGPAGSVWLRGVFMHFADLNGALVYAAHTMDPQDYLRLAESMEFFDEQYGSIWQDGAVPSLFLQRFKKDPQRRRLQKLLARIADALDVDLSAVPTPTIYLVPVPAGHGTHATAVGPYLLLEVRPADHLAEQASVIVHENAHYLFYNMNPERRARVLRMVERMPPPAQEAWRLLNEALPTALGQGVADREFRAWLWSTSLPWYHLSDVDAYAKAIYPLVDEVLSEGRDFDERFFRRAIESYPARHTGDQLADR